MTEQARHEALPRRRAERAGISLRKAHPLIGQAVVIGDGRKYLTALITVDADNIKAFAEERGFSAESLDELLRNHEVIDLIRSVVEEKNTELASFETIKDFRFVPEFTIDNGLLTPTLKPRRGRISMMYEGLIVRLYDLIEGAQARGGDGS